MLSAGAAPWRSCAGSRMRTCACSSRERQFIQDASHELRTPITVALGHAELVERASRDPELAEDARIVVDELLRLRRLADRLLLLATSEDPDFLSRSPVDVGQLLAAVLQRWAPIARSLAAGPPRAGHRGRATPTASGWPWTRWSRTRSSTPARATRSGCASRRQGDQVAIIVADSGTGMPADRLETIFERFARLDEARSRDLGGVGLGLAIVKAIVQAHGGTVRGAEHGRRRGSVFQLLLPLEPGPDPASASRGVVAGQRLEATCCMASLLVAAGLLWLVAARRVRAARGPAAVSWRRNALFLARPRDDRGRAGVAGRRRGGHLVLGPHGPAPTPRPGRRAPAGPGPAVDPGPAGEHTGDPAPAACCCSTAGRWPCSAHRWSPGVASRWSCGRPTSRRCMRPPSPIRACTPWSTLATSARRCCSGRWWPGSTRARPVCRRPPGSSICFWPCRR